MCAGIDSPENTKISAWLSRTEPPLSRPNGTVTIPTALHRQRFETIHTLWTAGINGDKRSVSRFGRFNPDCWKEHGCRSCTDVQSLPVPARPICSYSIATIAANTTKPSYCNTVDKLVAATLLQSLHSILEKNTCPSSQRDMECYVMLTYIPV